MSQQRGVDGRVEAYPVESKRERILDAAEQVFGARGYRGGSLNDIALELGLTRAGVLHYFASKEAILLALLNRRDARLSEFAPDTPQEMSIFELLEQLAEVSRHIYWQKELIQLAHILTAEASGDTHPAHEWVASRMARYRLILATAIRHSQRTGELPGDIDPEVLAAAIFGIVEGLENQWLVDPTAFDPAVALALIARMCRGLAGEYQLPTS